MQFGLFTIVPWHESLTQSQALHDALEQIELADRLGLDEVWREHRFSRHGLLSGFSRLLARSSPVPRRCVLAPPWWCCRCTILSGGRRGRHVGCAERWPWRSALAVATSVKSLMGWASI